MKILLTCHQFFPRYYHGTERYTLNLAKSLQVLGHEVVVLTTSRLFEDSKGSAWYEHNFEGVRVIHIDLTFNECKDFSASYTREDLNPIFADILCQERPDILHCCHLLYLGTNFLSVAALSGVPILMTLTDFFGICWTNRLQTCQNKVCSGPDEDDLNCIQDVLRTLKQPFRHPFLNLAFSLLPRTRIGTRLVQSLFKRNLLNSPALKTTLLGIQNRRRCISEHYRHVDRFIVATSYLRDSYVRSGYAPQKFKLLHFGIDQPDGEMLRRMRQRYESLSLSKRPLIIGFIGQISKHKGVLDLLVAYKSSRLANTELHLYGDVQENPKIAQVINDYAGENPAIKLCGTFPGDEIYQRLSTIDVLVLPSTWAENSPLVLLNALASRTMVVASDVEGMAELIVEGVNGHLSPPGDSARLGAILASLSNRRSDLLEWFDNNSPSYQISPLDYARQIEFLYAECSRNHPQSPNYVRSSYPTQAADAIQLSCRPNPEPNPLIEPDFSEWIKTKSRDIEVNLTSSGVSLRLLSASSHLFWDRESILATNNKIEIDVQWLENGQTVIYYSSLKIPRFCEEQKLLKSVPEHRWCRITIKMRSSENPITGLRWDPLFNRPGAIVLVRKSSIT